jgi:hypothetical protein
MSNNFYFIQNPGMIITRAQRAVPVYVFAQSLQNFTTLVKICTYIVEYLYVLQETVKINGQAHAPFALS